MFGLNTRHITETADRVRLFLVICGVFLFGYYTFVEYSNHGWESAWVLLVIDIVFLIGLVLFFSKYKSQANIFYLVPGQVFMTFLIFKGGGVHAPGVFWLSSIPVIWALLYHIPGLVIGYVSTLITYAVFWSLDTGAGVASFFPSEAALNRSMIENFILFSTFISAFILAYTIVLRRSQDKIEEKQNDIESLLKILVHDISNPLMIIRGSVDQIESKFDVNGQSFDRLRRSSERLLEIVSDVRKLYALRDGKLEVTTEYGDLMICLKESVLAVREATEKKFIKIVVHEEEILPVEFNKTLISNQVFVNILSNAIKFTPNNGEVAVTIKCTSEMVVVDIVDQGVGIPQELLARIFELNKPTNRVGTEGEKGTGYGLLIAKQVMEKHGGSISIVSPPVVGGPSGTLVRLQFQCGSSNKCLEAA